jgi:tocopherol cyclase
VTGTTATDYSENVPALLHLPRNVRHPEGVHELGAGSFEGWYVKVISADQRHRWAFIPGIFRGLDGNDEAFVQVLDGASGRSWYHRYPADQFEAATDRFDVRVGPNEFTEHTIAIDVPGVSGRLGIVDGFDPWPVNWTSPGVMGWYAWVPDMQCYHGVCSFGHDLTGSLTIEGESVDFTAGRGYVEKDWGQAFPAGYLWMHTNSFPDPSASLMASLALIPWRGRQFRGFICGLRESGRLHRFATYTGARTTHLSVDDEHVRWTVRSRSLPGWEPLQLRLTAERAAGGLLHAPIRTEMHRRVEETLNARVHVVLSRGDKVFFDQVGECAGLEVHGDTDTLLATGERR